MFMHLMIIVDDYFYESMSYDFFLLITVHYLETRSANSPFRYSIMFTVEK